MTNYFDRDAVSATLLKAIIKQSPVHAEERMKSFEPSANMKLGTAVHAKLLSSFDEEIAVAPEGDRRRKEGKDAYAAFLECVGSKTIITHDQSELAHAMSDAVLGHPEAWNLFEECTIKEAEHFFNFHAVQCKAKIDMANDKGTIVDLKTTVDASPDAFSRQSANLLYHMQLAWYAKAMGMKWNEVDAYIIAVENTKPHGVSVFRFDQTALLDGWQLCCWAIEMWKEHQIDVALGDGLHAYGTDIRDLYLPAWATNKMEENS